MDRNGTHGSIEASSQIEDEETDNEESGMSGNADDEEGDGSEENRPARDPNIGPVRRKSEPLDKQQVGEWDEDAYSDKVCGGAKGEKVGCFLNFPAVTFGCIAHEQSHRLPPESVSQEGEDNKTQHPIAPEEVVGCLEVPYLRLEGEMTALWLEFYDWILVAIGRLRQIA